MTLLDALNAQYKGKIICGEYKKGHRILSIGLDNYEPMFELVLESPEDGRIATVDWLAEWDLEVKDA